VSQKRGGLCQVRPERRDAHARSGAWSPSPVSSISSSGAVRRAVGVGQQNRKGTGNRARTKAAKGPNAEARYPQRGPFGSHHQDRPDRFPGSATRHGMTVPFGPGDLLAQPHPPGGPSGRPGERVEIAVASRARRGHRCRRHLCVFLVPYTLLTWLTLPWKQRLPARARPFPSRPHYTTLPRRANGSERANERRAV
jgi:hypothetical protein